MSSDNAPPSDSPSESVFAPFDDLDPSQPPGTPQEPDAYPSSSGDSSPAFDLRLFQSFVSRWPSAAAREELLQGVLAFDGPTGRAPFIEDPAKSDEENEEAHRVWAIAVRTPADDAANI